MRFARSTSARSWPRSSKAGRFVGIPIDEVGTDLRSWAQTHEVKLWVIRKLVEFGNADNVMYEIPEEYRPTLDTSSEPAGSTDRVKSYGVRVADLVNARLLSVGQTLLMPYKPRGGESSQYEATVLPDGSIKTLGRAFSAPSDAALLCVQAAGSKRNTVNGWTSWKTANGETLADLRERFIAQG